MTTRADDGMTLIEVLLSMMIMMVIIVPLTAAFVLGLGRTTQSLQDAGSSSDTQVLTTFFDADVANALSVGTSSTCGAGAGRTVVLALTWLDGATQTVSYVAEVDADAAAEAQVATAYRLERVACGPESSTHIVAAQAAALPTATCDRGSCASAGTPRRVSLTISQHARQITGDAADGSFTYTVTGTRRVTA